MPRTSLPTPGRQSGWHGVGMAWTLLSELISAIAVWGGIGFGLDRLFHTWPVLFAIGMVLGYGAGAYLIYRRGFAPGKTPGVPVARDTASRKDEPKT
jgi:ATP synthase protein I